MIHIKLQLVKKTNNTKTKKTESKLDKPEKEQKPVHKSRKANTNQRQTRTTAKVKDINIKGKTTSSAHQISCLVTVPREQARSCNFGLQTKKHRMNLSGS